MHGKNMRSKWDNRGKACILVGYADDHSRDVYRFFEYPCQKNYHEQTWKMAEHNMETLEKEMFLCKKTTGTFSG